MVETDLRKYIFKDKTAEVIIGEYDGKPAGFALFFHNFSTFRERPGIYVEDLFVKPELMSLPELERIFDTVLQKSGSLVP